MEIINANRNNLASVLMGKNIQFPWRGQNDVVIFVPYEEWLEFIKKYKLLLQYRKPLNYEKMLEADEDMKVRYFLYDVSWALYSELACSSNLGKDATLILPHFDGGKIVSFVDVIETYKSMSVDTRKHYDNALKAITRNYYSLNDSADSYYGLVELPNLSDWNTLVYEICIFLQSRSSSKIKTEKLNIDWRS
jgi:hypothetical protein